MQLLYHIKKPNFNFQVASRIMSSTEEPFYKENVQIDNCANSAQKAKQNLKNAKNVQIELKMCTEMNKTCNKMCIIIWNRCKKNV